MAWQNPVTTWGDTYFTHTDMNRICGDINYLCGTTLKDDYTPDDIPTRQEWAQVLLYVGNMVKGFHLPLAVPNYDVTPQNFALVESGINESFKYIQRRAASATARRYVGSGYIAQQPPHNFVR